MQDSEISAIIQVLNRVMEEEFMTVRGMAHRLGFSAGHLSMILSGQRRPGIRFVRAVIERFPELGPVLLSSKHEPPEKREPSD